jgi:hypothetical protein
MDSKQLFSFPLVPKILLCIIFILTPAMSLNGVYSFLSFLFSFSSFLSNLQSHLNLHHCQNQHFVRQ